MLQALSDFLVGTHIVDFISTRDWAWPLFEILHFIGMSALIGTVGLIDARILGFAKGIPIAQLERLLPLGVAGFVINAVTGFMFIAGNPVGGPMEYLTNLSLQIKMLLVLLAGINVLVFYFAGIAKTLPEAGGDAAPSAKAIAATSLVIWFGVILMGRLIMYNDTLLYALGM
jgi:hypothetical protein